MAETMIEEGSYKDAKLFYAKLSSNQIRGLQLNLIEAGYLKSDDFDFKRLSKYGKADGYLYDAVRALQKDLKEKDLYSGKIDGKYGQETKQAFVKVLQSKEYAAEEEKVEPIKSVPKLRGEAEEKRRGRKLEDITPIHTGLGPKTQVPRTAFDTSAASRRERELGKIELKELKPPEETTSVKTAERYNFLCTVPGHKYFITFKSEPKSIINGKYFQLSNVASASEIVTARRDPVTLTREQIAETLKLITANLKEVRMEKKPVLVLD
ncbi:peptidoglycan-binding protein [Candidatus Micrarchaeota archaeon]|nr:peptidoglycan-binding protein [Candidatus Micrarchaeota archaeon]